MLELLNQLDGFDAHVDVKVIMATNKIETLDPALIRPGRIDRKIEFPAPDQKTRRHIFQIHTTKMNLGVRRARLDPAPPPRAAAAAVARAACCTRLCWPCHPPRS